jgi:hypothetical protein
VQNEKFKVKTKRPKPGPYVCMCVSDAIKQNEMRGACGTYGEGRGVYRVLVGKPEGKRPLGRPRRRWEDNIKMDLQEVGYSDTSANEDNSFRNHIR